MSPPFAHGLRNETHRERKMFHSLMYDGATQEGVMFHLVSALSEFGKLGLVCIGSTHERARLFYDRAIEVLDAESES